MLALSLWQPWATLVVIGAKRVETRSWPSRHSGGLLIHAAKKQDRASLALCRRDPFRTALKTVGIEAAESLPFGAILGRVMQHGCERTELHRMVLKADELMFGDYSPGRWAHLLSEAIRFVKPIPYSGSQRYFEVPDALVNGSLAT